jgi:hypothetical protein
MLLPVVPSRSALLKTLSLTLSAAMAAKKGAPVYSRQPPTTATRPAWPLCLEA